MAAIEFDVPAMEIEIPAMEVEVPAMEIVLPANSDSSIFLCSESGEICQHACCAQDHKILWHNPTFLENDSDVEDEKETTSNTISDIIETFQRRTSNLGNLTSELLYAAQSDFEEALTDAIVENFMREYGLESGDEADPEEEDGETSDGDGEASQREAEVIDRILANCVSDSSSDDDDDMFLSPPAVRRRIGNFCAYDDENEEEGEET